MNGAGTNQSAASVSSAIFDLDGTLLNSMPIWEDLGNRYLEGLGIVPEKGLADRLRPMTMAESSQYLKEKYDLSDSADRISTAMLRLLDEFYEKEVQLKDGARDLLREFQQRKMPLALASAGVPHQETAALKRLGILDCFTVRLFCEELHLSKETPEIYQLASVRLGCPPSRCLVFEDQLPAIRAAKSGGFKTAAVFDEASSQDWPELKKTADYSLENLIISRDPEISFF